MSNVFFGHPILNAPYEHPSRNWELENGQPTQQIFEKRRLAEYISPQRRCRCISCWFIGTDYNEESFFVRYTYFLGANDPYKTLNTVLKVKINVEAWASLNSDTSQSSDKPTSGRIAVKFINYLRDEVMKVFRVG